jgi:alpha-L-glutamate ligase-like protein
MSGKTALEKVLGINGRNIDFIQRYNDRRDYPIADDKLLTKEMLAAAQIPHARLLQACRHFHELQLLPPKLRVLDEFVMKPARGMAGGGVLILRKEETGHFLTPAAKRYSGDELLEHGTNILYGVYSIDNTTDALIVEERIQPHPFFTALSPEGVGDIRVIVFRGEAVMAMSRLPSKASDGKANLALGAVGLGIEMTSGRVTHAATKKGTLSRHPDTGVTLMGRTIPFWEDVLRISEDIQRHTSLSFLGVDLVIDARRGPLVLEINVRPGLEIQNVNRKGLRPVLQERTGDHSGKGGRP